MIKSPGEHSALRGGKMKKNFQPVTGAYPQERRRCGRGSGGMRPDCGGRAPKKRTSRRYICAILAPTEPSCSGLSSAPHSSVTSARPAPGELAKCGDENGAQTALARVRESFDQILCRAGIGEEENDVVLARGSDGDGLHMRVGHGEELSACRGKRCAASIAMIMEPPCPMQSTRSACSRRSAARIYSSGRTSSSVCVMALTLAV